MAHLFISLDPASIIETRALEDGQVEYFVHYIECKLLWIKSEFDYFTVDRRLDEWVPLNRIDCESKLSNSTPDEILEVPGQNDGRLTRTQKRRYNELNHTFSVRFSIFLNLFICV